MRPLASTQHRFSEEGLVVQPALIGDCIAHRALKHRIHEELDEDLANWYDEHPEAYAQEFFGSEKQDPDKRVVYSVFKERELVGTGGLLQFKPGTDSRVAELSSLYLHPDFRGRRLGFTLCYDLLFQAYDLGFDYVHLVTRKKFSDAIMLYHDMGFQTVPNKKYPGSKNSFAFQIGLNSLFN